jgi:hypothetical protein
MLVLRDVMYRASEAQRAERQDHESEQREVRPAEDARERITTAPSGKQDWREGEWEHFHQQGGAQPVGPH